MHGSTIVVVALFGGGGLGLLAYGLWATYFGLGCAEWPTATGTVVTSDLQRSVDRNGTTYRAEVVYKYRVADREHVADRVFFGDGLYSSFATAAVRASERYRPGDNVAVLYDPARPERAVLEPGTSWPVYGMLALGTILTGLAGAVALGLMPVS